MSKPTITIDELRVILKWAEAYITEHPDSTIGHDTLFPQEIDRLKEKLSEAVPQYLLGSLNSGFLLGFKSVDSGHPLQEVWERIGFDNGVTYVHGDREKAVEQLRGFLEQAGLVAKKERRLCRPES